MAKIQKILEERDERVNYEELISKFPWIVEREHPCITSPDSDGFLCGLLVSQFLDWEIVGFWTPEYLAHRRETLQQFRHHRILIAVPEKSRRKASLTGLREEANIGQNVLVYKTVLKL